MSHKNSCFEECHLEVAQWSTTKQIIPTFLKFKSTEYKPVETDKK